MLPVESLAHQLMSFLAVAGAGMAGGFLFDLYRLLRMEFRRWSAVVDGLFWLVAGPSMMLLLTLANWASLRLYLFVAAGLGFFLYVQLVSPLVTWVLLEGSAWVGAVFRQMAALGAGAARWPATRVARLAALRWAGPSGPRARRAPLLWQSGWVGRGGRR
ncbi:spore cortex biosynthesis protein YabQ [Limnochorda pilosa]|uniref:Spore cortex biosynthesis protein YabQ n=1 Tax=Limnochorda pilosa TaxID=1555112 RepID=A0A0K2SQI9_LIMPI|nr:spore cortex biosynthesis protein YabQ [Limnochorda pilosa]